MTKITIICGPTACGKTPAAVQLAKAAGGEVISADSMQIYRGMDIGTAKATPAEMQGVPHHLIDELWPNEAYNVAIFARRAADLIADIAARGKMPIICGGTGFYINALLYGANFDTSGDSDRDTALRAHFEGIAASHGAGCLHDLLREVDSASADAIPPNNVKRVVRALEYHKIYGRPISAHNAALRTSDAAYDAQIFVLHSERAAMYDRINKRVDKMLGMGLVSEVEALLSAGYSPRLTSMQGLGYKEIVKYLQRDCTLDEAVNAIKQGTRRFAKRQVTWFKHQLPCAEWVDVGQITNYELRVTN